MDIGKINSNTIGNTDIGSAAQSADKAKDDSFEKALQAAADSKDDKALKSACQQFEGIMLNMLYKDMKATIMKSDLIQEDPGTDIYQSMLDDSLMDKASKTGTLGLADSLYKQLSKQLGTHQPAALPQDGAAQAQAAGSIDQGKKAADDKPDEK